MRTPQFSRTTPALALWLLTRFGPRYRSDALTGDLIEQFRRGRSRAWVWRQVLGAIAAGWVTKEGRPRAAWQEYRGLLTFLVLMCGFRSAWADWVYVPSGSMNPTILEGDRLLVDKHVYGLRVPFSLIHLTQGENPQRGDIVVFDSPQNGISLVKRLIAVPGDTVTLDHEQLIVNGAVAQYSPGDDRELRSLLAATQSQEPSVLRESGVGLTHDILLLPHRVAPDTLGPMIVPKDMYFVLGDNRDNSADSRYIGFVPRKNFVGRAMRVVVSFDPDHYYLPRRGRLLAPLN